MSGESKVNYEKWSCLVVNTCAGSFLGVLEVKDGEVSWWGKGREISEGFGWRMVGAARGGEVLV
ncbi:hypothetical protein [Trueperella sp. LYQ143]|uniref:hypothetical protein n=1 Tax=Trueperella sp. LYQ143 TaxID=3391059 RepID=UPI003982FE79